MFTNTLSQTAERALALLGKSKVLDKAYLAGFGFSSLFCVIAILWILTSLLQGISIVKALPRSLKKLANLKKWTWTPGRCFSLIPAYFNPLAF